MPLNKKNVVVYIDQHPKTFLLLRNAAKKAKERNIDWVVLYLKPDSTLENAHTKRLMRLVTLAESFGAKTQSFDDQDAVIDYMAYNMSNQKIDSIVIDQYNRKNTFLFFKKSFSEKITFIAQKYAVEVQIIPLLGEYHEPSFWDRLQEKNIQLKHILSSFILIAFSIISIEILISNNVHLEVSQILCVFLTISVIISMRYGFLLGVMSIILGLYVTNYHYMIPYKTFNINNNSDNFSAVIFLISSIILAATSAFSRSNTMIILQKEKRIQALFNIQKIANNSDNQEDTLKLIYDEISDLLQVRIAFCFPKADNQDDITVSYPNNIELSENDLKLLKICWKNEAVTGINTLHKLRNFWRFEPMITANNAIGVLAVEIPLDLRFDASFARLISALADQIANIIERLELSKLMTQNHVQIEREKLRSMLLSSVSHDLKTPLASIIGSMSLYARLRTRNNFTPEIGDELVENTLDEAQRLDSFISNILDMTKIESGDIQFNQEWVTPNIPLHNVQKRLSQRLRHHTLIINNYCDDNLQIMCDLMMTEQVLQNILDNAVKYSPYDTKIHVGLYTDQNSFYYSIKDQGKGIPENKISAIFDKYERLKQSDTQVAGTGLGLAICKAIIEKQNGHITVHNNSDVGAEFRIYFNNYRSNSDTQTQLD